jgi:hypothetical protein
MSASCERRARRRRGRGADRASHRAWDGQLELARTLGIARVSSRRGRDDAGRLRSGSAAVPVRVLLVRLVDGAHAGPAMGSASWIASVPLSPPRTAQRASRSTRPPKSRPGIPTSPSAPGANGSGSAARCVPWWSRCHKPRDRDIDGRRPDLPSPGEPLRSPGGGPRRRQRRGMRPSLDALRREVQRWWRRHAPYNG